MNIVPFKTGHEPSPEGMLKLLDDLRHQVIEEKIAGLAVIVIEPNDETVSYMVATRPVTRLRFVGAIATALQALIENRRIEP